MPLTELGSDDLLDFDHFPCGFLITSLERKILFANTYFEEELNWDKQALNGRNFNTLLTRASQLFCDSYVIPTLFRNGRCFEVLLSVISADGRVVPKVVSAKLMPCGNCSWVFIHAENRSRLFDELQSARAALEEQREQLDHLSRTDPLTNLANRRELEETLNRTFKEADRSGQPVALLMMDIDHFKTINDRHGHDIGDKVLRALAEMLKTNLRETDTIARFGGDEFAWVLPNTNESVANDLCRRLHKLVSELVEYPITISIGISVRTSDLPIEYPIALKRADQALYAAKRAGRNTSAVWAPTA